jgi:general secretion pathway protein I
MSGRRSGFTLIEVVVALAILGIALTVIIELFSGGLRLARVSEEHSRATNYARMKMEEVGLQQDLGEGTEEGQFDEIFRWQVGVKKIDLLETEKSESFKPLVEFLEVKVDVFWKSGAKERSTRIESYKTVKPKES